MVRVVRDVIRDSDLAHIACVYFSWFDAAATRESDEVDAELIVRRSDEDEEMFFEEDVNDNEVLLMFGRREPAEVLRGDFEECLLCACYAWDGNAWPGNEYWLGRDMLSASGDPAAAACSTISFVQNPMINVEHICGENARFYFFDGESGEYEAVRLGDMQFEKDPERWLKRSVLSIPYKRDTLREKEKEEGGDEHKAEQ